MTVTPDEWILEQLVFASRKGVEEGNQFFNKFSFVDEMIQGNYSASLNQGISLLHRCLSLDPTAFASIHKGAAYYYLGVSAFLSDNYQNAVFFFDASVAEDLRAGVSLSNPSLAMRFLLLEGGSLDTHNMLVDRARQRVEELIKNYNERTDRTVEDLTIDEVRQVFLRRALTPDNANLRSLATAFISYCLEWEYLCSTLDIRTNHGTAEPYFIHLFKGCVLFESLMKVNPKTKVPAKWDTLGKVLFNLGERLFIDQTLKINELNLQNALDKSMTDDTSIQKAISMTGKVRNSLGHNFSWNVNMDKQHYSSLFRMISSACLHVIACLYR